MNGIKREFVCHLAGIGILALFSLSPNFGRASDESNAFDNSSECIAILTDQSDPPLCISDTRISVVFSDADGESIRAVSMKWMLLTQNNQPPSAGFEIRFRKECHGDSLWCSGVSKEQSLLTGQDGSIEFSTDMPQEASLAVAPKYTDRPESVTLRVGPDQYPECLDFVSGGAEPLLCIVGKYVRYHPEDGDIADAVWVLATLDGTPVPTGVEVPIYAQLSRADGSPVGPGHFTWASETSKGTPGMPADQAFLVFHWPEPPVDMWLTTSGASKVLITPSVSEDPAAVLIIKPVQRDHEE